MRYQDELFRQREELLLDTALALFRECGWEKVTVSQLAARAGVAKGTVYKHFASKEAIYASLALRFSRSCLEQYESMPHRPSPLESIREVIRAAFARMLSHPLEVQLCLHCDRPEFQSRLDESQRGAFQALDEQYNALFHRLVEAAVAAGEIPPKSPESLYWGVDAVFQGVMARIAAGGLGLERHATPSLEIYSEHVVEFITAGLLGRFPDPGPEASP
ncbi:TetR family transcriptional regulator [Halospina denitrificans]|uniref:TetR family transcriptional regulator n=1 Tax=Halospina denitrificans TaxID=332522 RepID=A0A4R7JZY4_9GAMM|nr:TetR/AcrR family transcriptional regulator [Halospina denitrificans]TDT44111.1 TetR family transcriptional regulator [Halospina denitrificans]